MDSTQNTPISPQESTSRRRVRGSERVRVTRACDRCKGKKIRCTGRQPCEVCLQNLAPCTYNKPYSRGRRCVRAEELSDQNKVTNTSPNPEAQVQASIEASSHLSPEPAETDLQGHYVGPESGVSFLLRVQRRLHDSASFSRSSTIFTFGDAPLPYLGTPPDDLHAPYSDPALFIMLSKEESTCLVRRYFEFAVPVDRFLHQPTVESWLIEFQDTMGRMKDKTEAPARRAVLFMVFAIAQEHLNPSPTPDQAEMSVRYFLAASHQLKFERGAVRLTSIQARLCQCLWLLSQSRINHCWSIFGTVVYLIFSLGLHRRRRADPGNGYGHIEIECRRRTFWNAYYLDNYLSTTLGRPRSFHSEDIDQQLPSSVDDEDIHVDYVSQRSFTNQSLMSGAISYFKLSQILSKVLRDMYPIRGVSFSDRCALATKYSHILSDWRIEISAFLEQDGKAGLLIPIFQRQRNILNLAYWHTVIVTHRPFILSDFARLQNTSQGRRDERFSQQTNESVQACLDAAMHIAGVVDDLAQSSQFFRAYWFTSYAAFSAAVILYVYAIQHKQNSSRKEECDGFIVVAHKCQRQISDIANPGSLASRYCLVLEELHREALQEQQPPPQPPPALPNTIPSNALNLSAINVSTNSAAPNGQFYLNEVPIAGNFTEFYMSPSSSLADMTSWSIFESMVMPGYGCDELEMMLGRDRTYAQ